MHQLNDVGGNKSDQNDVIGATLRNTASRIKQQVSKYYSYFKVFISLKSINYPPIQPNAKMYTTMGNFMILSSANGQTLTLSMFMAMLIK